MVNGLEVYPHSLSTGLVPDISPLLHTEWPNSTKIDRHNYFVKFTENSNRFLI